MMIVHIHTTPLLTLIQAEKVPVLPAYLSVRDREDNSRTYVIDRGDETTIALTFAETMPCLMHCAQAQMCRCPRERDSFGLHAVIMISHSSSIFLQHAPQYVEVPPDMEAR